MHHSSRTTIGLVALALAASTGLTAPGASASTAARSGSVVDVRIDRDRQVHMPRHIDGGKHTWIVTCARSSSLQLLAPRHGYTKREAARDANRAFNRGDLKALRRLERNVVFEGGVNCAPKDPGVMKVDLREGKHWAIDTNQQRTRARDFRTFFVTGDDDHRAAAATAGGSYPVIRAVGVHKWAKRPLRISHKGVLTFRNVSPANHFLSITKLAKGKTMRDFRAWIRDARQGGNTPPPVNFRYSLDTGVVSPGLEMSLPYSLPRGRYVLVCFWPDARTGEPHAFMGMFRGIRLR